MSPTGNQSLDVVMFGEVLIDLVSRRDAFAWHLGGAPANAAIAARKLGAKADLIATVGDDYFGEFIRRRLEEYGLPCKGVASAANHKTTLAFLSLEVEDAPSNFLFYRDADLRIGAGQVEDVLSPPPRVFCFGSLSLVDRRTRASLEMALEKCKSGAVVTVFDLNVRRSLWPDEDALRSAIDAFLTEADVVKANQSEALLMTGSRDPEEATRKIWRERNQICVITLGEKGCFFRTTRASGYIPAFRVDAARGDDVGMGDAFVGALCAGIARCIAGGQDYTRREILVDTLMRANAAGAITATVKGAVAPNLSEQAVQNLLKQAWKSIRQGPAPIEGMQEHDG